VAVVVILNALYRSVQAGGEGSIYIGSRGILALLFAIAGLGMGTAGKKQKDVFEWFPKAGFFANLILVLLFAAVYAAGMFLL
jgi:hypothetical protein